MIPMIRKKLMRYTNWLAVLTVLWGMSSCIDENNNDCGYIKVTFDYSYNMTSLNLLANQADHLALYVFDDQERLVHKTTCEESEITNDYCLYLNDLSEGSYKFVSWAQSKRVENDGGGFLIPDLIVGSSTLDELSYYLTRAEGQSQCEMNNLLIGVTEADIIKAGGSQTVNIKLKKVNKKVRVVLLPYGGGSAIDVDHFTFKIVDEKGNGHVHYDYELIDDEKITYHPYYTANSRPTEAEILRNVTVEVEQAAIAELNTSRIIETNNPTLSISSKESDQEIISINLPWFFSLTGMESHKEWSIQEYLDRQDKYAITLFMQGDTWMQGTIIINGWVINTVNLN